MINKSQSISVRLSQEDYEYLMSVSDNGALTQSERVREVIRLARESSNSESFMSSFIKGDAFLSHYAAKYFESTNNRSQMVEAVFDFLRQASPALDAYSGNPDYVSLLEKSFLPALDALFTKLMHIPVLDLASEEETRDHVQQLLNKFVSNK
jgi:hypothetical protein